MSKAHKQIAEKKYGKLPPGIVCGHFKLHWTRMTSQSGTVDVAHCQICGVEIGREYPRPGSPYRTGRP